jgi:pimeloyl-ACP methyl ester carboxylesterase
MLSPYRSAFRRALADLVRTGDPFPERGPIDCTTLLAWGDSDPAQGFSLVTGMQSVVRDLRIVRFPRCGHFPHSETPQAVNDVLLPFLAEA